MQAERIAHASDLAAVLSSLWEALDVPSDSVERSAFSKVLAGPQRLHARSLEKVSSSWHVFAQRWVSLMTV